VGRPLLRSLARLEVDRASGIGGAVELWSKVRVSDEAPRRIAEIEQRIEARLEALVALVAGPIRGVAARRRAIAAAPHGA
jgi:hypothetical protein